MRRSAPVHAAPLLAALLLLGGCGSYVGNPTSGMGGFLGDVLTWNLNPNRPAIESTNGRRVMGLSEDVEPLQPEPGNVWPGPLPPARTMSDLQRDMSSPLAPIDAPRVESPRVESPRADTPRGSGTPVAPLPPAPAPRFQPAPQSSLPPPVPSAPASRVLQTPQGPATTLLGGNGVETFSLPNGRTGIVMPNANGTLTLIGPDGTTQTIPAPR